MSESMKGEFEVFKILRDCAMLGLAAFGIDKTEVQRFAQANMEHADRLVLFNLVGHGRYGWQYRTYSASELPGKLGRKENWIDEQSWQVSTLKRMRNSDTESTASADDVAECLVTWFNGKGLEYLRTKGMSTLPIDPREIMVYNDDSSLYQRRPVFNMTVLVPKMFSTETPKVVALEVETHPI